MQALNETNGICILEIRLIQALHYVSMH